MSLILASASPIRRAMLDQAGIAHRVLPAGIDESAIKTEFDDPRLATIALAGAKALAVSGDHPGEWVIGSDSMITVDGRFFDKPASRADAANHLRLFSGKAMTLMSAVALAKDGKLIWSMADQAVLAVRRLSDSFIAQYLDSEWPDVGYCVGVFRLEGLGVNLFDSIDGDHFTVLGMPLLPLLGALRERGLAPT
ncbi:MAG: nucleoside triphosphate pyrophosphatase [Sphingomicrobium sp.]